MANPKHVEIVKQGKDAIAQWREANPRVRFDLRRAELDEADLNGVNLVGADLSEAKLFRVGLKDMINGNCPVSLVGSLVPWMRRGCCRRHPCQPWKVPMVLAPGRVSSTRTVWSFNCPG